MTRRLPILQYSEVLTVVVKRSVPNYGPISIGAGDSTQIHTWYLVPGTWYLVPGTLVPGSLLTCGTGTYSTWYQYRNKINRTSWYDKIYHARRYQQLYRYRTYQCSQQATNPLLSYQGNNYS